MSHRISLVLSDDEFREVWINARHRHFVGKNPEGNALAVSAFGYFKKYPIPEKDRALLEAEYRETFKGSKAVQLEGLER